MAIRFSFRFFITLPALLLAVWPCQVISSTIHIATPEWQGQTAKDGSGLFFDLLRRMYEPHGIELSFEIASWNRSIQLVRDGHADAIPTVWRDDAEEAGLRLPRMPLYIEYTSVVFKRDRFPEWKGSDSLRGRSAVWINGYNYHRDTPLEGLPLSWTEVAKPETMWRMLAADRVDVLIDARMDVEKYMNKHLVDTVVFKMVPLWGHKAYLGFSDRPSSEKLMEIFDESMAAMLASGELATLHEKWGMKGFDPFAWEADGEMVFGKEE
ncbi:ABC-type amino acid transport substrate-binding protein [Desulfobotulus alkaliphilus]|uniref:ABC-type amino acid transport substrate-binding protein n=1 Tax=Desulfobotulus alkaliphilus TaxID=622671 RepID=A0A562RT66_9BACT|nr:transporter substrate-binding domain-containing protein [Desulfobotulus alkaliphilus]TWI72285.1 ABC-type amino acid transport substrate-binding protein [Desulfobotulus alkaliphilus]